jgi:hypothetical protein
VIEPRRLPERQRAVLRPLALAISGLVAAFACRTETPDEHYFDGKHPAAANGGRAPSTGGRAGTGASSEPAPSSGGAGGTGSDAQAGSAGSDESTAGDGGIEPSPPAIDCGPAPVSQGAFTREALRIGAIDCAAWQLCQFENTAIDLDARVATYASEPTEVSLERAAAAWKQAMDRWSQIELFQFGPLSSKNESAGKDVYLGQGLRDAIYGWPSVSRCRVEDQVASQGFASKGMDGVLTSARGLYALEYLLFYPGSDSACAASSTTATTWAALGEAELLSHKLGYARALAADVRERARALSGIYREGESREAFVSASGYPNEQESLNVLGWALVYVEREVKDWKLGVPAGYTLTHPVSEPESPYAGSGTDDIRQNLLGFRSLFQGCGAAGEGIGFDDWLIAVGHAELASDIVRATSDALVAVEAFPPLPSATKEQVQELYATIKVLTDFLKTDLFGDGSPIGLKLPAGIEGDTD